MKIMVNFRVAPSILFLFSSSILDKFISYRQDTGAQTGKPDTNKSFNGGKLNADF
jgi:hypothetical protein